MAGDWIKMRTVLQTSPKVVRIASALKADRLKTVGGLHSAWCLFDAHSEDGRLDGYTPEVLDSMIGWPGFTEAMASVGWLLITPEALELPEFDAHNGQSAKRRAQEADRKRKGRASAKSSASDADKNGTREEKRREENNTNTNSAFVKPTLDELIEAFTGKVPDVPREAQKFFNFYESKGWMVGKNKMKSWPHAVGNWISNNGGTSHATTQSGSQGYKSASELADDAAIAALKRAEAQQH